MSTLSTRIGRGNAADVQQRGISVIITPEEGGGGSWFSSEELVILRLGGMDVVNGSEPSNPNNLDANDPLFVGWTIQKYLCANGSCTYQIDEPESFNEAVEIENRLSAGWSDAYLNVEIVHNITYPDEFLYEVTSAYISASDDSTAVMTYRYNTGTLAYEFPVQAATYSIQLATGRVMTSCHHAASVWRTFKDTELEEEVEVSSPDAYNIGLFAILGAYTSSSYAAAILAAPGSVFTFELKEDEAV